MEMTSFRLTYMILLGIQALSATIFFIAAVPALYFIWVCASFACAGGNFVVFPAVKAKLNGKV
jgi:hypothetical protein